MYTILIIIIVALATKNVLTDFFIYKNQLKVMATLQDFQNAINSIDTATTNISAYVQGTGMSATEQSQALASLNEAITKLHAAIPQV